MKFLFGVLILIASTSVGRKASDVASNKTDTVYIDTIYWQIKKTQCKAVSFQIIKTYPDSSELVKLSMKFYTAQSHKWKLQQCYDTLECESNSGELSINDLNLDGAPDLLLYYGCGARGINANYYVFLSDTIKSRIIPLNNLTPLVNPSVDSATGLLETAGFAGSTYLHRYRIEKNALVDVAEREIWEENSILYKRTITYNLDGTTFETIDSTESLDDDISIYEW